MPFQPVPTPDEEVALTPAHVFGVSASLVLLAAALGTYGLLNLALRRHR